MRFLFFLFVFLSIGSSAGAQQPELVNDSDFQQKAQAAVDSIYNFNPQAADSLLEPWKEKHPDHPLWTLIKGMNFWWEILTDLENTEHDESFFDHMKQADYEASKLLQEDRHHVDGLLIKAISNGYIARQYANREEWVNSVSQARKALRAYDYLLEDDTSLADLQLAEGLKLYYSAYIPEEYPVVKTVSWALPDGDKQKGLKYLQKAADESIFARAEASYFLGNININYENNYEEAIQHYEDLYHQFPRNNFYVRVYVRSLFERRKFNEADHVIEESLQRFDENDYPFSDILQEELFTWQGRIFSQNGNTEEAKKRYKQALQIGKELSNTDERTFRMAAAYFLGELYFEEDDYDQARKYLEIAAGSDNNYRKNARNMIKEME